MGKNLIQQARGKGTPRYKAPSFRYEGRAAHPAGNNINAKVVNLVHCQGHSAPLADVVCDNNEQCLIIAPEGLTVGQTIKIGDHADVEHSNVLALGKIPEGSLIHNIELNPGDGGKFVRASGTFARVIAKKENLVTVMLPSKKTKDFNQNCRAAIGIVAGGGRTEKPFLKAGFKMHKMRARNKLYPRSSAAKMNAVDHPFGNKRSSRKSKARPISRNAPPGRKVGMIAARRTGRNKR